MTKGQKEKKKKKSEQEKGRKEQWTKGQQYNITK